MKIKFIADADLPAPYMVSVFNGHVRVYENPAHCARLRPWLREHLLNEALRVATDPTPPPVRKGVPLARIIDLAEMRAVRVPHPATAREDVRR